MNSKTLPLWFQKYKESSISGRYVHADHIKPLLNTLDKKGFVQQIGMSENNVPIHLITLGTGTKKLLFWSQMHGNESTTTKAIFDCINTLLDASNQTSVTILKECTLYIVPMLNPDGAKAYTRLNYNSIDLNRDAQNKSQRESQILHELITTTQPEIAFNLHGQRTIFSAGETNHPATVSFLSPAGDRDRAVTKSRKIAMEIIGHLNKMLQNFIPDGVGRYDDGFNINCVGDTLSDLKIPTILFEAGHYPKDYKREQTRAYIYYSLMTAIIYISENKIEGLEFQEYFKIPENGTCFYDLIIRNVFLSDKNVDIAIQYREELSDKSIKFVPIVAKIGDLQKYYGHSEIVGEKRRIRFENDTVVMFEGDEMLIFFLEDELFSTELRNN